MKPPSLDSGKRRLFVRLLALSFVALASRSFQAQGAPPQILNLTTGPASVGQYQKIEWRFDLSKTYVNPYYYYDPTDTSATNPSTMSWFGIDGVSVDLHLIAPSGKNLVVPAFFFHDYLRLKDASLGMEILGKIDNGRWAARFAAAEVGTYQYYFTVQDKDGTGNYPAAGTLSFAVTSTTNKGFVHPSPVDSRFLTYDGGGSFVPVGSGRQWWSNNALRSYEYEAAFSNFRANGVNLTRVWDQVDFALAVEGTSQPVWVAQNTTYGTAQGVEVNTSNVHSGLRSARPATGQGWYQRLAVNEPGKLHKLTVWIRTNAISGGQAQANVRAGDLFNSGTLLGQVTPVSGTTPWTAYSVTLTPNASIVSINLFQTGTSGTMYVDDIAFGPVDASGNVAYNIVSDADFERHFFKDNPGNDPNADTTLPRPIGTFMNPWASYEMDKIVESAQANGVEIQDCACSGPWFTWPVNPNDMTLTDFAQPWALNSYKRNLRYRVARWGYSPAILSWELHNEWGHINSRDTPTVYNLIVAIRDYLTAVDPYRHLLTTSQNSQAYSPQLWSSSGMDYANYHWYLDGHIPSLDADEPLTVMRFAWCLSAATAPANTPYCQNLGLGDGSAWTGSPRPWVWGEVGVGLDGTQGNTGEAGSRFLHNIVWAGLFTPLGTTPLEWWWYHEDTTATAAKFAARKAASAFFSAVDYANGRFVYVMTPGDGPPGYTGETIGVSHPKARVYAMRRADKAAVYLWVQHRDYIWSLAGSTPSPISPTLTISNLLSSPYTVQTWSTTTGAVLSQQTLTPSAGSLSISVAGLTSDVAIKLETTGATGSPPGAPTNVRIIK
jgi:hypothetical protein